MPTDNQGFIFLGAVASGVLIYAAVTDNRIIDILTAKASNDGTHGDIAGEADNTGADTSAHDTPSDPTAGVSGVRLSVVNAAHDALDITSGYSQVRPFPGYSQMRQTATDCSGFVTDCYQEGGAPDPNGLGYTHLGWTGTMMARGRKVSQAVPGDLHFWSGPAHVAMDVGNGNIIGWGSLPGPKLLTLDDEHSFHSSYYGVRQYLPTESALSAPFEQLNQAKARNLRP